MCLRKDRKAVPVRRRLAKNLERKHNFCIELPKTVVAILALGARSGNTFWTNAITKEIENIRVAFKILPDGDESPVVSSLCCITWYLTLRWKSSYEKLESGRRQRDQSTRKIKYAIIVSKKTVCIVLLFAALKDHDIKSINILNAYV